ncbi:MAG: adenylate/guanylate cyclase domain-containing protein [Sneathiella sp.]
MSTTVERKLTTILCADVCGYSKQMGQDEEGTHARLKAAREVFSTYVTDYSGRIVNMTGDGLVAEFGSVVQAVQCAMAVQDYFNGEKLKAPDSNAMIFRIGLNLGDVIIDGEDIFGDGVNIAARLETLTAPGGINISGTVYDHVKGKFPENFKFLGDKQFKNIKEAIPVYAFGLEGALNTEVPTSDNSPSNSTSEAPTISKEEQIIRAQVRSQAAFYRRGIKMAGVIFFLFLINIMTSAAYLWFLWPSLPLFTIFVFDAIRVFGKMQFASEWEERKVEEYQNRKQEKVGKNHRP